MKKIIYSFILVLVALSVSAQIRVLPPVLVLPVNGDFNQMPNVLMDWNPVSGNGQVMYEFQLDVTDTFSDPLTETLSSTAYYPADLIFGQEYFWRVKAIDDLGESEWSEVFSFTIFNDIELDIPGDGDDEITPMVKLEWVDEVEDQQGDDLTIEGFSHFEYQIALDDQFNDIFTEGSVYFDETDDPYEVEVPDLLFETTFFWRVRATHSNGSSNWSEVWSFETMIEVELDSPDDEEDGIHPLVELEWDDYDGLTEFIYQYSMEEDFSSGTIEGLVEDEEYVEINGLYFGDTYYWRVKGFHTNDTTIWSEVWSFTVLDAVEYNSPANGDEVNDYPIELEWDEIDGVTSYEVMIADNEGFSDPMIHTVTDNSYIIGSGLEDNTDYFWKVKAMTDYDETAGNDYWSFTFNILGVDENALANHLNIFPNPCNDYLNIGFDNHADLQVEIFDLLGQKVLEEVLSFSGAGSHQLDVSSMYTGVYLLRINNQQDTFTTKINID